MVPSAYRLAALVAFVLVAAGCSGGSDGGPTSPTEPGPTSAVTYAVLGASDGIGYGSSVPCAVFDLGCENGTGYAQAIRRRFQADGRTVTFNNLSWPGAVLSRPIAGLAISLGRSDPGAFIDRYPPFVAAATTHVTIFVGGNDANIIGTAVGAGLGGGDPRGYINGHVSQWGRDLAELVADRDPARAPDEDERRVERGVDAVEGGSRAGHGGRRLREAAGHGIRTSRGFRGRPFSRGAGQEANHDR